MTRAGSSTWRRQLAGPRVRRARFGDRIALAGLDRQAAASSAVRAPRPPVPDASGSVASSVKPALRQPHGFVVRVEPRRRLRRLIPVLRGADVVARRLEQDRDRRRALAGLAARCAPPASRRSRGSAPPAGSPAAHRRTRCGRRDARSDTAASAIGRRSPPPSTNRTSACSRSSRSSRSSTSSSGIASTAASVAESKSRPCTAAADEQPPVGRRRARPSCAGSGCGPTPAARAPASSAPRSPASGHPADAATCRRRRSRSRSAMNSGLPSVR